MSEVPQAPSDYSKGQLPVESPDQTSLFEDVQHPVSVANESPAAVWEREAVKHALDELFSLTHQYKGSREYNNLLEFVGRFRSYSPFNAMLVHVQMPGAKFVAPPRRWLDIYKRTIKPGARPIIILQPMGPVMFVFDVGQTEPIDGDQGLPPQIENPFRTTGRQIRKGLPRAIENGKRDGVRVTRILQGSQAAGYIVRVDKRVRISQPFQSGLDSNRNPILTNIPVKYDLVVNAALSDEEQYATIAHELAHLYCGHIGSPNPSWWPNRIGLDTVLAEFEAESVAHMVCQRFGIQSHSEKYLVGYLETHRQIPRISLELVMKAAGLIESMTKGRLKLRKA